MLVVVRETIPKRHKMTLFQLGPSVYIIIQTHCFVLMPLYIGYYWHLGHSMLGGQLQLGQLSYAIYGGTWFGPDAWDDDMSMLIEIVDDESLCSLWNWDSYSASSKLLWHPSYESLWCWTHTCMRAWMHTILYHTVPYCTILYHIVPYCTILYHTVPYCTMDHTITCIHILLHNFCIYVYINVYMCVCVLLEGT